MKYSWLKSVFPIAAIFSFRMLGLFMLIPVFTIYAVDLKSATPALIGIALGAYGLSQGLLQLPFGMLSDHYGRKRMIGIGLLLFLAGSLLGAFSHSIYAMIFARILQGAGAIGSVLIALLADLTPDSYRTRAMAVIGVTIGISFSLAMVLSTVIAQFFGLAGIFYLTALLACTALVLLYRVIPKPPLLRHAAQDDVVNFKTVIADSDLWRFNAGIFFQHWILTATFFVTPWVLKAFFLEGLLTAPWHFYLVLMLCAFVFMAPLIYFAEKKQFLRPLFIISIVISFFAQGLLLFYHQEWWFFCFSMFFYFLAFNILEASLPSFVSQYADVRSKGTAMGVYSSCQFLGIFFGGLIAGLLFENWGTKSIFLMNFLLTLLWFFVALPKKTISH